MYVTPDEILEGFLGIANDLTVNDNEYLKLIEDVDLNMFHDNTCPLLFVIIMLTHSAQCCYNVEKSPLI